jgi:hypothetical protein
MKPIAVIQLMFLGLVVAVPLHACAAGAATPATATRLQAFAQARADGLAPLYLRAVQGCYEVTARDEAAVTLVYYDHHTLQRLHQRASPTGLRATPARNATLTAACRQ